MIEQGAGINPAPYLFTAKTKTIPAEPGPKRAKTMACRKAGNSMKT
jgi:hypothetical protein